MYPGAICWIPVFIFWRLDNNFFWYVLCICFPGQDSVRQRPQRSLCHGRYRVRQHADAAECQPKDERQGTYVC